MKKIKVIYPLAAQTDYTELMYSLRSVCKYLPHSEIIIIGSELPEWITGVTWINLPDVVNRKQISIKRKIIAGLHYTGCASLVINDDSYLLQPQSEFPFYWHGTIDKYGESGAKPLSKELLLGGHALKNFDIHYPIVYDTDFADICSRFPESGIIKSMYCNYKDIEGIEKKDCKIKHSMRIQDMRLFIKDLPSFNTGTIGLPSALAMLQELFPESCKYENY